MSAIEKRCQDWERQLAAKVRRLDDEDAAIREQEAIRQQSAEAPDDVPDFQELTPPPVRILSNKPKHMPVTPKGDDAANDTTTSVTPHTTFTHNVNLAGTDVFSDDALDAND
ncbi:hypothetical protein CY34DRAFT_15434 [Suillus luteus UH-Slu-Lm8-n1]|uniref:Uncharacterized protein n=1 Tax=Suillus luteus UH-Slu-Lm8-n1 TaxID=930992 RepID=A0A0D0B1F6_9AGAM|nr:hypothetical protein CY34DRAFT_15434 [Suillus luteus UH-Slu-Lm8-n1]